MKEFFGEYLGTLVEFVILVGFWKIVHMVFW